RIELQDIARASVTGASDLRGQLNWSAQLFFTRCDVESVQPLNVGRARHFRLCDDVHRVRRGVDDRGAGDAELGVNVGRREIAVRYRRFTRTGAVRGID